MELLRIAVWWHISCQSTANPTWGDIFESSKHIARTSLLPIFSEKRRSSFELWALKQHSEMAPQVDRKKTPPPEGFPIYYVPLSRTVWTTTRPINNNQARVLATRAAATPLSEILQAHTHWLLCRCHQRGKHTKLDGYFTHHSIQAGWRKIQSGNNTPGVDPLQGSDQDTWMQAYTPRLLLPCYRAHTLWVNAQRSLWP